MLSRPQSGRKIGLSRHRNRRDGRAVLRAWPLAVGLLLLAAFWLGPLPEMSRTAFSPHMILHLGLVGVAAPLLAFGLLGAGLLPRRGVTVGWAVAASLLEFVIVWGWHTPGLHEQGRIILRLRHRLKDKQNLLKTCLSVRKQEVSG